MSNHSNYLSGVMRCNALHAAIEAIYRYAGVQRSVRMMMAARGEAE